MDESDLLCLLDVGAKSVGKTQNSSKVIYIYFLILDLRSSDRQNFCPVDLVKAHKVRNQRWFKTTRHNRTLARQKLTRNP